MSKPNTECIICNKSIYRIPSRISGYNTCSIACRNSWFSKEKHPSWKGGIKDLARTRQKDRERRLRYKQRAVNLLGGKCTKCGYNKCIAALDFHHIDPLQKDKSIKDIILRKWNIIENELKKCILICSNCHREEHYRIQRHE